MYLCAMQEVRDRNEQYHQIRQNVKICLACAGRDLTFLLVSYGVNAAITLGLLAYMTRRKAGVAGIWACLLLFQVSLLLSLLLLLLV